MTPFCIAETSLPRFSWTIFFLLSLSLAASAGVFVVLVRQWTSGRRRSSLKEWASLGRFKMIDSPDIALPEELAMLRNVTPVVHILLKRDKTLLIRVETAAQAVARPFVWHLLIQQTAGSFTPAGLRPVSATSSFTDLFSLTGFPSVLSPERFVAYAANLAAAQALVASGLRGLIPADIGLLLHGSFLTIDFSARPFDTIEFDRMLAISEQLLTHLPGGF